MRWHDQTVLAQSSLGFEGRRMPTAAGVSAWEPGPPVGVTAMAMAVVVVAGVVVGVGFVVAIFCLLLGSLTMLMDWRHWHCGARDPTRPSPRCRGPS